MKIIKQVAVASLAAMAGLSLFACSKPEEKITLEFNKELDTNETKFLEKEEIVKAKLNNLSIKNLQGDIKGNATVTVEKDNETWYIRYKDGSIDSINNEKGSYYELTEADKNKTVEQLINELNANSSNNNGENLRGKDGKYLKQEVTKDKYGNIIDWNNKITEINDSNHTALDDVKGFINLKSSRWEEYGIPCYVVNIGDEKNWEIGPNGYPNPPEEFKERCPVIWKDGAKIPDNQMEFVKRTQMSWTISYYIDGKLYQITGSDRVGSGRTVWKVEPGTDFNSGNIENERVMEVSNKNKSTNEELLIMCIANDDIVKQIKKGAPIKDSLIQGK